MRANSLIPIYEIKHLSFLLHHSISDFDLNELLEIHENLESISLRISKNRK